MKTKAVVLACALLAACGGSDTKKNSGDTTTGSGDLSITLTPAAVSLAPGSSTTVTIAISRSGKATGASVALSLGDAPAGVTGALDKSATTDDSATITLSAAASAAQASGTMTVTASALDADPQAITSAPLDVTVSAPPTITVTGRVVSADLIPLAGAIVNVYSHDTQAPQTFTTNNSGGFTADNVTAPYDVKISALGVSGLQVLWLGLSRTDPLLSAFDVAVGHNSSSVVSLSFSGGLGVPSAGARVAYTIGCPDAGANGDTNLATDTKTLEGAITAGGQTCTINALQHHPAGASPDALAFGSVAIAPNPTGTVSQSVALTSLSLHAVSVSATTASGNPLSHATMIWHNQARAVPLSDVTDSAGGYSGTIQAPADDGLGMVMVFNETSSSGTSSTSVVKHLSSAVTSLDVTVPVTPSIVSPTAGFVNPATLVFTINGASDSGYVYSIASTPGNQQLYIASMDDTLPASVLADHGMALANSQSYHWQYYTFSNIGSADDLASAQATLSGYLATDGASYSLSVPGTFSTP